MSYAHAGGEVTTSPERIAFNLEEVPEHQMRALCLSIYDYVKRLMESPENRAEYLAWKAARAKKADRKED